MGNKKNMLKNIISVFEEKSFFGEIHSDTVFYDVFGGSGIVAQTIRQYFPNNRVIWNDYDDFKERLDHIDDTEALRAQIWEILKDYEIETIRCPETIRALKDCLQNHTGYFDAIQISPYLCFSGHYCLNKEALLKAKIFCDRISREPLVLRGYLEDVERVRMDYKDLLELAYKESGENAFLILDPPYLQTQKGHYDGKFWGIVEFLDLLATACRDFEDRFIFFSSESSGILEFLYFINNKNLENLSIQKSALNLSKRSGDLLFYRKNKAFLIGWIFETR